MPTTFINRNSKPDTLFLSLPEGGGFADLVTDVSQLRTNLTNNVTYASESPSTRTAITYPREISLVLTLESGDSGTLIKHGENALNNNYTYRISVASNVVTCKENGTTRVSAAVPDAGSEQTYLIHWSTRRDGASVRSELMVYNLDTGGVTHAQATHAAGTTNAAYGLYIGGDAFDTGPGYEPRWQSVRIGRRFHSTAEAKEDWISQRTPPFMSQARRDAVLAPDRATLDIAADGSFCGPALLWSGHAFLHNDRRLVGALVNARLLNPTHITNDYLPVNWWRPAPGDSAVKLCRPMSWYRPVPGKVTRAHCRLFVRQTIEVGDETAEVRYRIYSMDNLPAISKPNLPLTYYRTAEATCNTNHSTALGEWIDLGVLPLSINAEGKTWLAVGIEFDEDSPLVGDTGTRIGCVTIEPYAEIGGGGGGLDILQP